MLKVNPHYEKLPGSYLFAEIARRVKEYGQEHPDAQLIRLGIGDVTRPLAPAVVEAMEKAAREMGRAETFRGYGPDYGYDFLIQAILDNDYKGLGIQADEVFVSDGAKCDVSNVQELFSDDAVVAVTDPVYPVYVDSNAMAGRAGTYVHDRWDRLCYLPCTAENGFVPPLPDRPVDVIYLCYPNNPTGTVLTKAQLKPFVEYAKANGAIIVYDAAYKAFITSGAPRSIYEVEGAKDVAIECCSYSKTAGFTGTRCGFMVIPHGVKGVGAQGQPVELNAMWKRRMGSKFNGVSYPIRGGLFQRRLGPVHGQHPLLSAQRAGDPGRAGKGGLHRVRRRGRALYLDEDPRRHGQLGFLRPAAEPLPCGRHARRGLRPLRRRVLPSDGLQYAGKDAGSRGAHYQGIKTII